MDQTLAKKLWELSPPVLFIKEKFKAPKTYCKNCGSAHNEKYVAFTKPVVMNGKIQHTDLIGWCPACDQYDIFFQGRNANQEIVCATQPVETKN